MKWGKGDFFHVRPNGALPTYLPRTGALECHCRIMLQVGPASEIFLGDFVGRDAINASNLLSDQQLMNNAGLAKAKEQLQDCAE